MSSNIYQSDLQQDSLKVRESEEESKEELEKKRKEEELKKKRKEEEEEEDLKTRPDTYQSDLPQNSETIKGSGKKLKTPEKTTTDKTDSLETGQQVSLEKADSSATTINQETKKPLSANTKEEDKASTDINGKTRVAEEISKLYKERFDESLKVEKDPLIRFGKAYNAALGVYAISFGVGFTLGTGGFGAPVGAIFILFGAGCAVLNAKEAMDPEFSAKNSACEKLARELGIKEIGRYTIPFTNRHKRKQQLIKIIENKEKIEERNCKDYGVDKDFFNKVKDGLQRIQEREEREKAMKVVTAPSLEKEINSTKLGEEFANKTTEQQPPPKTDNKPSTSIGVKKVKHLSSDKEITNNSISQESFRSC